MPILTRHYTPDHTPLPSNVDELRLRFVSKRVNGKNTLLLLHPDSEQGFESTYVRYVAMMELIHSYEVDENVYLLTAKGLGQIVVTGRRIIGMITDGSVGSAVLDESVGSVYAFTFDLDDSGPVEVKKNWLGKPITAVLRSKDQQKRPFGLRVISVDLIVKDNGQVVRSSLPAFLEKLTP